MQVSGSSELTARPAIVFAGQSSSGWKGAYWERITRERSERERAGRERRAERGAAASAANLEEPTLELHERPADFTEGAACADGQVGVVVTEYPDGFRVVAYQRRGRPGMGAGGGGGASAAETESDQFAAPAIKQRLESSLSRSRALVVHRARSLGPVAMWTFTKRGKFESADEVWRAWRAFCHAARRRFGKQFRYVAVPELHSDGETWHLHVLFDRFYMVETLRVMWSRALGGTGKERGEETLGNVHAKSLRTGRFTPGRAARYVAKYVGKGFERCGSNRRVFGTSCGLHPTRVRRWSLRWDGGIATGINAAREWLCATHGVGWAAARFIHRPLWACAIAEFSKGRSARSVGNAGR